MLKEFLSDGIDSPEAIQSALEAIRTHLGMEIAFVSRFEENDAIYEYVDAAGPDPLVKAGDVLCMDDIYCGHILAGRMPNLIPDTAKSEFASAISITHDGPVGSNISVPIRSKSGEVFGMFCCFSSSAKPTLNDRDLAIMRVFADLVGSQLIADFENRKQLKSIRALINHVLDQHAFRNVYQPIFNLTSGKLLGFESLCRFSTGPEKSPDKWFADANMAGLGEQLELKVIASSLAALDHLPEDIYLSVNASPSTIIAGGLEALLDADKGKRLVIEITEHAAVANYEALDTALAPLRRLGVRLAVDDTGAGYASLHHVLALAPDAIKLDMSLTRSVDKDPARRALASALVFFSRETHSTIIAEGIETDAELRTLRLLGVTCGQGYLTGRPMELDAALALCA